MFLIRAGDRRFTMSPRKVQTIWLATGVHLSTDAIRLALEHHVDIALLDKHGEPYGRFWHARLGSTTLLRRRLLEISESEDGSQPLTGRGRVQLSAQLRLRRPLFAGRAGLPALRTRPLHRPAPYRQLQQALAGLRPDRVVPGPRRSGRHQPVCRPADQAGALRP